MDTLIHKHRVYTINNYSNPTFNTRALDASRVPMPKLNSDKDDYKL